MKRWTVLGLATALCGSAAAATEQPRQECLGRVTFRVPEDIEWGVFPSDRVFHLGDAGGGGMGFTEQVGGRGESGSYDLDGMVFYVSAKTTRDQMDKAAKYIRRRVEDYQIELKKDAEAWKRIIQDIKHDGEDATRAEAKLREIETDIPKAKIHDHDLGIPDSYVLGAPTVPFHLLLWRNQRVYYFKFGQPSLDSARHMQELVARFRTRELYEVPQGPGICFPYGFIADDGKTEYRMKNSLRFTRTPNVIFSLLTVSRRYRFQLPPHSGLYDTDFRPGYDHRKWSKRTLIERLYIGRRLAAFEGWSLDPKPDSGEQERAWFGLAHIGGPGTLDPMLAIQVLTFQKEKDGLPDYTPPPEDVLPRLKELTRTIEWR